MRPERRQFGAARLASGGHLRQDYVRSFRVVQRTDGGDAARLALFEEPGARVAGHVPGGTAPQVRIGGTDPGRRAGKVALVHTACGANERGDGAGSANPTG